MSSEALGCETGLMQQARGLTRELSTKDLHQPLAAGLRGRTIVFGRGCDYLVVRGDIKTHSVFAYPHLLLSMQMDEVISGRVAT